MFFIPNQKTLIYSIPILLIIVICIFYIYNNGITSPNTPSLKASVKHLHIQAKQLSLLPSPPVQFNNNEKLENRIVSFSLFGNQKKYRVGAIINANLVKTIYPGWRCRFYHDDTVPQETLNELLDLGSELVDVTVAGIEKSIGGMFWRFLVASDPLVDRFIVRDVDSRLSEREAAAVNDWIRSEFPLHSMRDHPNHDYPLNGGMWGGTRSSIPSLLQQMDKWRRSYNYMADMLFLDTLWKEVKDKTLSHDAYFCGHYPNCRPFPIARVGDDHVGLVVGGFE